MAAAGAYRAWLNTNPVTAAPNRVASAERFQSSVEAFAIHTIKIHSNVFLSLSLRVHRCVVLAVCVLQPAHTEKKGLFIMCVCVCVCVCDGNISSSYDM